MPNCKLCNKALDAETADAFFEHCRNQNEALHAEQPKGKTSLGKKFLRHHLIPLVAASVVPALLFTFTVLLPRKDIPLAEQTVKETVQLATGKTPFVSSQVAGHCVETLVCVRYAFSKEELKTETCPFYYVSVSGKSATVIAPVTSSTE